MNLSIIISNRNDTVMLAVTVRSCIEALKALPKGTQSEIVIVDNSDKAIHNTLPSYLPTRYIREGLIKFFYQPFPCLFTAREDAAKYAQGTYILCLDSHMLVGHNMFLDLYSFMEVHKDDPTIGFAHAPINWAHQHEATSKHDRDLNINELGNWNLRYDKPRTITWKGMPWICRREWFLSKTSGIGGYGALSDKRLSWGGGDLHIGTKPWLCGFKNWAVPCSPGIHIGPFPKVDYKDDSNTTFIGKDKYRVYSNSGQGPATIGFLVSCYVLGGEPMMERNKDVITYRFGKYIDIKKEWSNAIELGQEEKDWLDSVKIMTFEDFISNKPWEKMV